MEAGLERALSPRRHVILVQSDQPVCAVERADAGCTIGLILLQRVSSSLPTETVAKVFLLPSGTGGFNLF